MSFAGSVVIVQQPGQVMRGGNFKPGRQIISTVSNPPLEKEVVGLMQKQGAPLDTNSLVKSITKATSLPTTIKTITASAVGVGVKVIRLSVYLSVCLSVCLLV